MNILQRENGVSVQPVEDNQEQDNPECVDTKLVIWEGDSFEEFDVDYLNQVYPEKINKNTMAKGTKFLFHFLSQSLRYWVELRDHHPGDTPKQQHGQSVDTPKQVDTLKQVDTHKQQQPGDRHEETPRLSTKDMKYISSVLQQQGCDNYVTYNRWGKYFNADEQFRKHSELQNMDQPEKYSYEIPKGQLVHTYTHQQDTFLIYKYSGDNEQFIAFKERFEVLFLFYIDGVSFVDQHTKQWQYYVIYQQRTVTRTDNENTHSIKIYPFVGVLSKFIFRLSSQRERHRISQVFVLPSYRKQGHAKQLLDIVYAEALGSQICFEVTTEEPSFEYQCLRDYKELEMILSDQDHLIEYDQIMESTTRTQLQCSLEDLLSKDNLRLLKQKTKLPGSQIQRLINLLVYARISSQPDPEMSKAIFQQFMREKIIFNRSPFKSRKKIPHITFNGQLSDMTEFFFEKNQQELLRDQHEIQEILTETLDGYRRVIRKLQKHQLIPGCMHEQQPPAHSSHPQDRNGTQAH